MLWEQKGIEYVPRNWHLDVEWCTGTRRKLFSLYLCIMFCTKVFVPRLLLVRCRVEVPLGVLMLSFLSLHIIMLWSRGCWCLFNTSVLYVWRMEETGNSPWAHVTQDKEPRRATYAAVTIQRTIKVLNVSRNFFEVQPTPGGDPEHMQRCEQPVTIKRMINSQVLDQRVFL